MFQVYDSDGSNPSWGTKNNAVVAQLVERLLAMQEVFAGSSPVYRSRKNLAGVAQLVERLPSKQEIFCEFESRHPLIGEEILGSKFNYSTKTIIFL